MATIFLSYEPARDAGASCDKLKSVASKAAKQQQLSGYDSKNKSIIFQCIVHTHTHTYFTLVF